MLDGWGNCEQTRNFGICLWKKHTKNPPNICKNENFENRISFSFKLVQCELGGFGKCEQTHRTHPQTNKIDVLWVIFLQPSQVQNMLQGSADQSILHKDVILENNLFGKNKVCRFVIPMSNFQLVLFLIKIDYCV